jgi:hypothetical protein
MVRPLDESQGSSPLQGRGSWLMCEVALSSNQMHWSIGVHIITMLDLGTSILEQHHHSGHRYRNVDLRKVSNMVAIRGRDW